MKEIKTVIQEIIDAQNADPFDAEATTDALTDALELLKEQEAVKPIPPTDDSDLWRCGNCNHPLFRCTHQRYCEMCGKAVKWNE